MLSILDSQYSRRSILRVGSLGLGSFALPQLLGMREAAAKEVLRDRSVVFLFLHGGPPQTETFDPKMDAPSGIRSAVGEIPTRTPGVTFGSTLTRLAGLSDKFTVVRNFVTGNGNHDIKPIVCRESLGANIGSLYSRVAGANDPATGMPTNVALFPRSVVPKAQAVNNNFGRFDATGPLGAAFAPFVPSGSQGAEVGPRADMTLRVDRTRLADRRHLLSKLDSMRRDLDADGSLASFDGLRQRAFDTILSGAADAFDIGNEDPAVLERYDTSGLIQRANISKRWNNHKNYADHVESLGKLMLLARRLCESGCGFVTVTTNFVWDMHADQNNATIPEGMHYCARPFDHAVSAFIEDVEARGLSEKILLVACGEMGRTPKINVRGGRDHWGGLAPLLIYGGGLNMGQVIGQSSSDAGTPASEAVTISHLMSTIMNSLVDVGELRLVQGLSPELRRTLTTHAPIPGLHG